MHYERTAIFIFFAMLTLAMKIFTERTSVEQVEEGNRLAPKFDENGLIPCVTTDYESGEVLMHGYMNQEAFLKTIELGEAVYYSRSPKVLWHKGATSGLVQKVRELRIDDDQDAVWLRVEVLGGASCHVGYELCYQVRSQVRISIWDQVRDRVKFQVCYYVSTQMLEDFDDA